MHVNGSRELTREIEALRERLKLLSEASLRITEDLDLDAVLQGVVDGARSLTAARLGVASVLDGAGQFQALITSGFTATERRLLLELPGGREIYAYLGRQPEPLRLPDLSAHLSALGLPGIGSPAGPVGTFLQVPIRIRSEQLGTIYLADKGDGAGFTPEDEETLTMFAAQAALAIANARRHREEQQARADLETLINTSPVGVAVFHVGTGMAVSFNREARRIVERLADAGQSPEELLEIVSFRRADGQETSLAEYPLAQALGSGESLRAEEIVLTAPDGRSVTVLINATPIFSEEGGVQTVVVTLQDMAGLEELQRLRADFLAMVSHELRTPLTSIKGSASTLIGSASSLDPTETLQFLRIIDDQVDHMQGLITDLLDVARMEAGTLSVSPAPTDVTVLVDQARSIFLSGGGRDNIHIDLPLDLPRVMADRRRIVQVLANLLGNAARYSPESTAIRIAAEQHGVYVQCSVSDDGVGIAADRLPGLFRKFSRAGDADGGGELADSGLGLAISRGIVEAHGGRIWAESEGPGRGTSVTFTLPAVEEAAHVLPPEPERTAAPQVTAARGRIRVLVVDDDPQTLRYVRDALTEEGFAPIVTGDAGAVGHLVAEERPHLVLLDLVLPGADGIELLERVPELGEVPVIFLSAYGRDQVVARALEAGADDYIVKPFSPTELVARIRAVLRRRVASASAEPPAPYVRGDLTVNYAERRALLAGRPIPLTDTEYRMLVELSVNSGRVLSHAQLLQRVWGPGHSGRPGAVRTVVKNVRRKLGDDATHPRYILSEPRVGYRMEKGDTAEKR